MTNDGRQKVEKDKEDRRSEDGAITDVIFCQIIIQTTSINRRLRIGYECTFLHDADEIKHVKIVAE